MKYVDAHCHLKPNQILPDDVGVAITNAGQMDDWDNVLNLANGDGHIYGAIGVHPWYVAGRTDNWLNVMQDILAKNPMIGVGEIGLDKNKPDMEIQVNVLQSQLKLANNMGRIAHIHCVGAWDKILSALKQDTPPAIVFHAFDASPDIVNQLLRYNSYFSFGHSICNPLRLRAQNAVRLVPHDRILSESDSGTPDDVIGVVKTISEILMQPLAVTIDTIYNNTMELLQNG